MTRQPVPAPGATHGPNLFPPRTPRNRRYSDRLSLPVHHVPQLQTPVHVRLSTLSVTEVRVRHPADVPRLCYRRVEFERPREVRCGFPIPLEVVIGLALRGQDGRPVQRLV